MQCGRTRFFPELLENRPNSTGVGCRIQWASHQLFRRGEAMPMCWRASARNRDVGKRCLGVRYTWRNILMPCQISAKSNSSWRSRIARPCSTAAPSSGCTVVKIRASLSKDDRSLISNNDVGVELIREECCCVGMVITARGPDDSSNLSHGVHTICDHAAVSQNFLGRIAPLQHSIALELESARTKGTGPTNVSPLAPQNSDQ